MAAKRRAETALSQTEAELQQLTLSQPPSTDAVDLEINGLMAQVATLGREVQAAEREVCPFHWRSYLVITCGQPAPVQAAQLSLSCS